MKTKLSVLLLCLCSLTLFATCSNSPQKQKAAAENVAAPIQNFLKHKYPAATILKSEKETNGTEVDIQEKNLHKEVWFDTKDQWVSTHWEISARDVPVAVMDALQSSAYNQYKVEDITAIERPDGLFYDFELKQDNNEIHVVLNSNAQIVTQGTTRAPGYDW
ncbi:PepSY-like domain-containing protein [Parabacteroides sp.]